MTLKVIFKQNFKVLFYIISNCIFFSSTDLFGQCACHSYAEFETWQPDLLKQREGDWEQFHYTATGTYVAEDKANYYLIRIISDEKPYGAFVYYQKLVISRRDASVFQINPSEFYFREYDVKSSSINRFVASEFFDSESSYKIDKNNSSVYFVKCRIGEEALGIFNLKENRFYQKVYDHTLQHGKYEFTSLRSLTQKDLKPLKKMDLKEMRNEIFARYHFIFKQDGYWDKYFNQFDWYHEFNEHVDSYLTYVEKENAKYILGFEGEDYYDDQFNNDFMDFWADIQNAWIRNDSVGIFNLIQFPLKVNGELDNMSDISIDRIRMMSVFKTIMEQEQFEIGNDGKPYSINNSTLFKATNPFKDVMLNTKQNSLGAFLFEKVEGNWKIVGISADNDCYNKIKNL
jgi:hypothetical protein